MVKVSVIIPTFNRADLLAQAIRSVLAQTYKDFELIIIDDGSTDNTREIVESFNDPRIRYIWQENQNRCVARNNGIKQACGSLIAFLDSDDLWFPGHLATQVMPFEKYPEVGLVFGRWVRVDADTNFPYPLDFLKPAEGEWRGRMREALLTANYMQTPAVVVRKDMLDRVGDFDRSLRHAEDWDLWIRLSSVCDFCNTNQFVAAIRVHPGNRTINPLTTLPADLVILEKHLGVSTADQMPLRLRGEMLCYMRRGFDALSNALEEAEPWLRESQLRANELGEPTSVADLLPNWAVDKACYDYSDRLRVATLLKHAAVTIYQSGSTIPPNRIISAYWESLAHADYMLKDHVLVCKSLLAMLASGGLHKMNRGLIRIGLTSLLRSVTASRGERIVFPLELELRRVMFAS